MKHSSACAARLRGAVLALSLALLAFSIHTDPVRHLGARIDLGGGSVSTYAELDASGSPVAIGVLVTPEALEEPPDAISDFHHCFDRDANGTVDRPAECLHSHEFAIPLPDVVAQNDAIPFKWVLFNWNPMGHLPVGVYDRPHVDVHFVIAPIARILSIDDGPCGDEFVQCDEFDVARRPLPRNYVHPDYQDVGAVVPGMGNHLIDLTGPEFAGQTFNRSWIYGAYDGRVTFYEEMAAVEFVLSKPNTCFPVKTPPAVAEDGYYPSESCIRYDEEADVYTLSMESFSFRKAEPPASL